MLVWGGWAYWVNQSSSHSVQTGVLQAVYSGIMTLYMSYSIVFFFKRAKGHWQKYIYPWLGTVGHTGLALFLVHWMNNTKNLLSTISLPLVVASVYSLLYVRKLIKKKRKSY